jgi:methyl-accepting chemotaxis protein
MTPDRPGIGASRSHPVAGALAVAALSAIGAMTALDGAMADGRGWLPDVVGAAAMASVCGLIACGILALRTTRQAALRHAAGETAAQRAYGRLMQAMKTAGDGVILYDDAERLVEISDLAGECLGNQRHLFVLGRTYEEIIRAGLAQRMFAEAVGREEAWLKSRLAARQRGDGTFELKMPDGRWLEIAERRTGRGEMATLVRNITARKAAETELKQAQNDIAALAEAAAVGDFSRRVDFADKSGAVGKFAESLRIIAAALGEVLAMMSAMSQGDLSRRIVGDYRGDLQRLKNDANAMAERLAAVVGESVDGMAAIQTATSQLAAGAADLSSRTEEQVASLEEMATAMRELSVTVSHNADNAKHANELAIAAHGAAESGGQVAAAAAAAMGRIEESAARIAEIVGMMDEIAFQTNLLALNAAVEAARAGEAGRGFAVVAVEVRALAQRSGEAAREIKKLIAGSGQQVTDGAELVRKAGGALAEILGTVKRAAAIVGEIAAASQEQSRGVQEVADAVSQLESVTQKNAALVEESTASLEEVDRRAESMSRVIGFFRRRDDDGRAPAEAGNARRLRERLQAEFGAEAPPTSVRKTTTTAATA